MSIVQTSPGVSRARRHAVAVDIGSTYTKACLVGLADGRLMATAAHPTTPQDLREGLGHVLERLDNADAVRDALVIACSSAGGGLRVAVAGLEEDLTVRAGRYAAMSAGARVVRTHSGGLDAADVGNDEPDLVLLTGGLDDGDEECLLRSAEALAASDLRVPVVIAGNATVADRAARSLARRGITATVSANVMPAAGVLNVGPARTEIREVFIRHVIGGRQVTGSSELRQTVRMATPDAVLLGTELLAKSWGRDVVVIDVGGATTDVHSYVRAPTARQGGRVRLIPEDAAGRTVEADLGVWSNAGSLVEVAQRDGLLSPARAAAIAALLPRSDSGSADTCLDDLELACLASHLAVRRHAGRLRVRMSPDGVAIESEGRDLRSVSAVVGAGGVFRCADRPAADEALRAAVRTSEQERSLMPKSAVPVIDSAYLLSAAGLLSTVAPLSAAGLLKRTLPAPAAEEI
jgi:uncharacterized protein (TIGR01319 family)